MYPIEARTLNREILKIRQFLTGRLKMDGLCTCSVYGKLNEFRGPTKKEKLINLFMWTWIDQVIYCVLLENEEFDRNKSDLYSMYRRLYKLREIEVHSHEVRGLIPPAYYLRIDSDLDLLHEKSLLLKAKIISWDIGVKKYFLSMGEVLTVKLSEDEFSRDLRLRHRFSEEEEKELKFLWE